METPNHRRTSFGFRLRHILQHGILAGMIVNIGLVPLFWLSDIPLLAAFSVFSVFSVFSAFLYAGCLALLRRQYAVTVIVLTYLEIVAHVATVVVALGWDGGFQYYLIVILPLVFISSPGYPRASILVAVSLGVVFIGLDNVVRAIPPLVAIDREVLAYIRHFNTLAAFALAGYIAWSYTHIVRRAERELAAVANTDLLSGLLSRRRASEMIRREIARCDRSGQPIAFILADIDDFKRVNDHYGHESGDEAIGHVSARLTAALRTADIVARWGGEEFLIVLPDTPADEAAVVAERIGHDLASRPMAEGNAVLSVTMTFGVTGHVPGESVEESLARADSALYSGKRAGKNRVETG